MNDYQTGMDKEREGTVGEISITSVEARERDETARNRSNEGLASSRGGLAKE